MNVQLDHVVVVVVVVAAAAVAAAAAAAACCFVVGCVLALIIISHTFVIHDVYKLYIYNYLLFLLLLRSFKHIGVTRHLFVQHQILMPQNTSAPRAPGLYFCCHCHCPY